MQYFYIKFVSESALCQLFSEIWYSGEREYRNHFLFFHIKNFAES